MTLHATQGHPCDQYSRSTYAGTNGYHRRPAGHISPTVLHNSATTQLRTAAGRSNCGAARSVRPSASRREFLAEYWKGGHGCLASPARAAIFAFVASASVGQASTMAANRGSVASPDARGASECASEACELADLSAFGVDSSTPLGGTSKKAIADLAGKHPGSQDFGSYEVTLTSRTVATPNLFSDRGRYGQAAFERSWQPKIASRRSSK